MNRLGAAVVGLGVGEAHARAFKALDSCDLRYVCDLDQARAQAVAAALGTTVAASFEQITADREVEVVSIASFDDAHAAQVIAALDRGKHVFVEKPMARTVAEIAAVKAAWQASSRHLDCNLVLRAAPLYTWLRTAIAAGELGEIYAIDGDYLYGRVAKITSGWRAGVNDYSVMEGGGIHLIDLMFWLTGQKPVRVAATGNRIATRDTAFRYRDFAAATFDFPSGLVGRVTANFGCVHRHQHVLRIFGTKATFLLDDCGARLHTSRNAETPASPIALAPLADTKGALVPSFVDAILAGPPRSDVTQMHFDVLSACAAADRAVDQQTSVDIHYV